MKNPGNPRTTPAHPGPPDTEGVEHLSPLRGSSTLFTLDPGSAHLNHGSYGAVPVPVQRYQAKLRADMERDPDGFFLEAPDRIGRARAEVATALGGDPGRLALITNVTEGVAIALDTVPLDERDQILVTDHGYGVVTRAAERRAAEAGAVVRCVRISPHAPDDAAVAERVLAAVTPRTKVAVLDLITSPTARTIASPALLAELRSRGIITIVDAAHAPGALPVDLGGAAGGADFWVGNLHKWAFAPRAAAVLAIDRPWRPRVRPLMFSWEHDRGFPWRVEWRGTFDYTPWLAAPAGFDLLKRIGAEQLRDHNDRLAAHGRRMLVERAGLRALPEVPGLGMRAVRLPPGVAEQEHAAKALMVAVRKALNTRIAVRPWQGGGILRISAQLYNRPEEYVRLADGLARLITR
ncbi:MULTISPECIES: aminotransferase class V-fold PLP-dependent enzyme [Kitasatospora]|uniref:Putative aminotransferase n=1 Tax=Kitasatospora setae (strain ATCC 33774 / DSM 43861 / JCM 3304 / KCC A-0304 / NBRC 14216 / KM-6054) TaxID=452652 RepID=E4N2U0_KITSK|nr:MULTISPECIES: aminotransferase class V-fold PLP-dependent enzyme [Kitasatospora]BAJ32474.1 putative aminotransferase [Kitasatospora setae KM-6054]